MQVNMQKPAGSVPSVQEGFLAPAISCAYGATLCLPDSRARVSLALLRADSQIMCNSPEKGTLPGDQLLKLPHKSCSPLVREAYPGPERKTQLNTSHSNAKLDGHSKLQTVLLHLEQLSFIPGPASPYWRGTSRCTWIRLNGARGVSRHCGQAEPQTARCIGAKLLHAVPRLCPRLFSGAQLEHMAPSPCPNAPASFQKERCCLWETARSKVSSRQDGLSTAPVYTQPKRNQRLSEHTLVGFFTQVLSRNGLLKAAASTKQDTPAHGRQKGKECSPHGDDKGCTQSAIHTERSLHLKTPCLSQVGNKT